MSLHKEIHTIRRKLFKKKFENELNDLNNSPTKGTDDIDRIEDIKQIIESIDIKNKDDDNDKLAFNEIDRLLYKKPWRYLKPFHRIIKIKEYIKENLSENLSDELQKDILNESIRLLNENKLKTTKSIVYDHEQEKVTKFPALTLTKDGFSINEK